MSGKIMSTLESYCNASVTPREKIGESVRRQTPDSMMDAGRRTQMVLREHLHHEMGYSQQGEHLYLSYFIYISYASTTRIMILIAYYRLIKHNDSKELNNLTTFMDDSLATRISHE
ncbi:hypothetical protein KIN20_029300 [Parelaphostrongylus tenuis]|uniref:Uncharacterized protein n=1 Tax=Parelaphostrongylus tenuis TaxID=148309 RepID=A0AAD5R2Z2_PARTN|nr:hypothetical protein KIN20_029300 [Parelaphostrongylus tenuis]